MKKISVPTPEGNFILHISEQGIHSLSFPEKEKRPASADALPPSERLSRAAQLLRNYFAGRRVNFSKLPIDWSGFTAFERKVLKALSRIPYGEVCRYSDLARKAGFPKASRAVGLVMRKNRLPIILPCHRVLQSTGGLGKYSAGDRWKEKLLTMEGVECYNRAVEKAVAA
jgi:methylated-DNA-[protein]-cysteine S-methyltransferase